MIDTYSFLRKNPISCIVDDRHLLMAISVVGSEISDELATDEFARFVRYESSDGVFRKMYSEFKIEMLKRMTGR